MNSPDRMRCSRFSPDFPEGGLTHGAAERIAYQLALIHYRLTLDIPVAGIGDGLPRARFSLLGTVMLLRASGLRLLHYTLRLVAKGCRKLLVPGAHLLVRQCRQLFLACLVRGDLRRTSAAQALLFQVLFDLLAARAAGVQVFLTVTLDFRLRRFSPARFRNQVPEGGGPIRSGTLPLRTAGSCNNSCG